MVPLSCDETTREPPPAACPEGFRDCDGVAESVCETHVGADPEHCGACGRVCAAGDGQEAVCEEGMCAVRCAASWADCNADPTDGCEAHLTDDAASCGSCARDCGQARCIDGLCEHNVLAAGLDRPIGIAADASHVYWASFAETGAVFRVSKTGGPSQPLMTAVARPYEVVVGDDDVFVTEYGTPPTFAGNVFRVPKAGGAVETLVPNTVAASELAADAQTLFWVSSHPAIDGASIHAVPRIGGQDVVLLSAEAHILDIVVHGGALYWLTAASPPTYSDGAIHRSDLDGTNRSTLAADLGRPALEIAVDDDFVYFGDRNDRTLSRVPVAGGARELIGVVPSTLQTIELAGAFVYVTTGATGGVHRVDLVDGGTINVSLGGTWPFDLVADDTFIYWSERGAPTAEDGAIVKAPR